MGYKEGKTKRMLEDAIVGAYRGSLRVHVIMSSGTRIHYAVRMCFSICNEWKFCYTLNRKERTFVVSNGEVVFSTVAASGVNLDTRRIPGVPDDEPIYIDHRVYEPTSSRQ